MIPAHVEVGRNIKSVVEDNVVVTHQENINNRIFNYTFNVQTKRKNVK